MKAQIMDTQEIFKPVVIRLTVESKTELQELWHRMNISLDGIKNAYDKLGRTDDFTFEFKREVENTDHFWTVLNYLAKQLGVRP